MQIVAIRSEEVLLQNELSVMRDEDGVNERRAAEGGISIDQALDEFRQHRLIHAGVARARGRPTIADRRRLSIRVRFTRRPRKETRRPDRRAPRQFDDAVHVRPEQLQPIVHQLRGEPLFARAERHDVALARDLKLHRAAVRPLLRIPKRAEKRSIGSREDAQIQREALFDRMDVAAPNAGRSTPQHDR